MKTNSKLGGGYFNSEGFGNLKIAMIAFAVVALLMLNLFQLPSVSLMPDFLFSDRGALDENFFFSFFLDFSHIFSSVFIVLTFILMSGGILILGNYYLNTQNNSFIFALLGLVAIFYLSVSLIAPAIERLEDRVFSGSPVTKAVYAGDYEGAYVSLAGQRMSELDRSYVMAQIAMRKFIDEPNTSTLEGLNSEARSLQYIMDNDIDASQFFDDKVMYVLYNKSTIQPELGHFKQFVDAVRRKTFLYSVAIIVSLIIAAFKLNSYRQNVGL